MDVGRCLSTQRLILQVAGCYQYMHAVLQRCRQYPRSSTWIMFSRVTGTRQTHDIRWRLRVVVPVVFGIGGRTWDFSFFRCSLQCWLVKMAESEQKPLLVRWSQSCLLRQWCACVGCDRQIELITLGLLYNCPEGSEDLAYTNTSAVSYTTGVVSSFMKQVWRDF